MTLRNAVAQFCLILSLTVFSSNCLAMPHNQKTEPVVKTWTEVKDGKTIEYKTIDGIMVHETDPAKQPQPPRPTVPQPPKSTPKSK